MKSIKSNPHVKRAKNILITKQKEFKQAQIRVTETFIKHKVFIAVFSLILLLVIVDYYTTGISQTLLGNDTDAFIETLQTFGSTSWILFLLIVVLEVIVAPIPSIIIYAVGGIMYGSFFGSILLIIGNMIGASICYLLARYFLKDAIEQRISDQVLRNFDIYLHKYGPFALFFLRLNPFTSSDLFSYLAGITRMKYIPFIVSTTLGLIPLILFQSILGASLIIQSTIALTLFIILSVIYIVFFIALVLGKFAKKHQDLRK